MLWLCLQGRADEIDEEDLELAEGDMQRDESSIPEMVVTVLKHYGVDVEPPAVPQLTGYHAPRPCTPGYRR